jgi:glycosyltransferase involved in cell wall biosynthesis
VTIPGRRKCVVLTISNLEFGGAQRQVVELANHMDARSFDVHICSLSEYVPLAEGLKERSRRLHVIRKRWKFDITVVPRLARLLRRLKADIVQGYLFDAEIAARLAGRLAGTPLVVGSERNTNYHLKRRQLAVYRLTRSCVDLIVANSNAGAAFNSRVLGHAPSIYRIVHNGVDVERFVPREASAIRRELGILPDEPVVGMFASFKHQKNHPLFFSAARRLLETMPRARFLLVGDELYAGMHGSDEYKLRMSRLVDELGIRERCVFLSNRDDVERLYCACDVTVLPSLFEGTPNVALESMACGVPVIATDVSDNAYIIPDGTAGFLVPLDDVCAMTERIGQLLRDVARRREMGQNARRWVVEEFSTARLAAKTAEVYETSLDAARRRDSRQVR